MLWLVFFGAGLLVWVGVGAAVYAGWEPPRLLFAGLVTYGLALSLAFHSLGWGKRRP